MSIESELYYPHKRNYLLEISPKIFFCGKCSSAIIRDNSGKIISTIKPLKYHTELENVSFSFLQQSNIYNTYNYSNYNVFKKIRLDLIKNLKKKYERFKLKMKTYFLALDYFFQICSILTSFSKENLLEIANICIILAAKTNETKDKAMEVKLILTRNISSKKYIEDEQYILAKLNYDLIRITSYDILIDILKCGFIFDNEEFNYSILNSVYNQIENMLYLFSETKHYINMNPKEIAIGIMGLAREILGLPAFSENIQIVFMNIKEFDDIHNYNYLKSLNKIRKCFKIVNNDNNMKRDRNYCGNNKDSNSDN